MDISSRLTSKGQITVPKPVRDALELEPGDELVFRVTGEGAMLTKTGDFIDTAGTLAAPPAKRRTPWDEVLGVTRARRAESRR